ncbi:MAG TPA: hydrogenase maturation nickel metallochaperone HypA [Caldilineae bacterium]|nr:hydrogenase maturation nickel metallochaperone HypA [Caldilineae bacterium]
MHELSITQSIIDVAIEAANANNASRITDIHLVIGDLTSIVDDSVQFYFDFLSKDTLAAGATLHFQRESATATCVDCSHQWPVTPPLLPECPNCNSARVQITGGREFFIESIEID